MKNLNYFDDVNLLTLKALIANTFVKTVYIVRRDLYTFWKLTLTFIDESLCRLRLKIKTAVVILWRIRLKAAKNESQINRSGSLYKEGLYDFDEPNETIEIRSRNNREPC